MKQTNTTNDFIFFLKKMLPRLTDLLTNNFNIIDYQINSDIATITTDQPHNLKTNHYAFIDNVYYSYGIQEIKSVEVEYIDTTLRIDNCLRISTNEVFFNSIVQKGSIILKNITTNISLNTEYEILKSEIIQDQDDISTNTYVYCIPIDNSVNIDNINILNEGSLLLYYIDDIQVNPITQRETTLGSVTRIASCYNGLKIVKDVISTTVFTVDLTWNTNRPEFSSVIDFTQGICKTNIRVYPYYISNQEDTLEYAINKMKENKTTGFLFISKNSNEFTNRGIGFNSISENIQTGIDYANQDISFNGILLFRVTRDAEEDDFTHYILSHEENMITDTFCNITRYIINNYFVDIDSELSTTVTTNILYKGTLANFSNFRSYNNVDNSVFKIADFSFKLSRFASLYNNLKINTFGLPIKKVENTIDFNKTDHINITVTTE